MGSAYTEWDDEGEYYYCPTCYSREDEPDPAAQLAERDAIIDDMLRLMETWLLTQGCECRAAHAFDDPDEDMLAGKAHYGDCTYATLRARILQARKC